MLTVLNDCHVGTVRSAGTTKESQVGLTTYIRQTFADSLPDTDLMILGDLFDKAQVDLADLLFVYITLSEWLYRGHMLYLVAGNHDLEKTSGKLSSFDMLGQLLVQATAHHIIVIKEPTTIAYGYVVPHLPNQAALDAALLNVPECPVLFLHCNYDNNFAAQSDQSLNISKEQVEACRAAQILIAHEHIRKVAGKVTIPGNQIATSISDWQGCNAKYRATVNAAGAIFLTKVKEKTDLYTEQPWDSAEITDHKFVKLVGEAATTQAAQVVSAVAKFRATSPAFVVSNGVRIASESGAEGFAESLEGVRAFDVYAALGEHLSKAEMEVLKGLE